MREWNTGTIHFSDLISLFDNAIRQHCGDIYEEYMAYWEEYVLQLASCEINVWIIHEAFITLIIFLFIFYTKPRTFIWNLIFKKWIR